MKRLLSLALLALSTAAAAATLNPVQLLNPAGSTSGQAIVSNGPSSAPTWQAVTATALGPVAANTLIGNKTGSSAAPTAVAIPSCSTANSALQWTSGTGPACGTTFALTSGNLSQFAATTSAQLLGVLSDETGSGAAVFGTTPSLTTPTIAGASLSGTLSGTPTFSGAVNFSGAPTATTAAAGTNTTQIATTAFVQTAVGNSAWTQYTPTVTASSGTITSVTAQGRYKQIGKTVHVVALATITTNGTGAGVLIISMPVTSATVSPVVVWRGAGREDGVTGNMLQVSIGSNGTSVGVQTYNNTYPGANGAVIQISITYEAA